MPHYFYCVIALFVTSLAWSRIDATCDPVGSKNTTQIKLDPGQTGTSGTLCFFPFEYSGTTYNDCIGDTSGDPLTSPYCDGSGYCNYWCATSCNYGLDSMWNYCKFRLSDLAKTNCSALGSATTSAEPLLYGGSGSGTSCYFPFLYNGACHYDCVTSATEPWCATTDVAEHVSSNYKHCRYTFAGKNDPSCASLSSATTYYIPPQVGNYSISGTLQTDQYGNCTFPFYYKEKCYDDCTTVDATRWYLIWCSTDQYYQPNKMTRVCPYYRKYRTYTGLAMNWGFYRIYLNDGCGSGGTYCNMSLTQAGGSVPLGTFGSPRMVLSSTATTVFEVMPQGNGYFILRIPLPCATNFISVTTDTSDVVYDYVTIEREFWNIKATATSGVYTVQSTWNSTSGHYLTRDTLSGNEVAKINSGSSSTWRFEQLSSSELASLSLPCEDPAANVNREWCAWSNYTYTGTTATRTRTCNCPAPAGSGTTCAGNSSETGTTVNGTWCSWSSYTVSGAYGTRTRECNCSAPAFGGLDCPGSGNDTGLVANASWCSWSSYTTSGAYATRLRNCSCPSAAYGGTATCSGSGNDTGLIVDGNWCAWSSYTVNGAYGTRTRECNCSAPAYTGLDCTGTSNDTGLAVNASWCAWSSYTTSGAYATRLRTCACPSSAYGGTANCSGSGNDTGLIVDGNWCAWSSYTVNGAYGTRTRECNCSAPAYTGLDCTGTSNDTGLAVNGTWCAWSSYTVNSGYATRLRTCACSAEAYGGITCQGSSNDTGAVVDGGWCAWSAYTLPGGRLYRFQLPWQFTDSLTQVNGSWCAWSSLTSGYGVLTRTRLCNCSAPNEIGYNCTGISSEDFPCNVSSCQTTTTSRVDGGWCSWGSWEAGLANSGTMSRSRTCGCPAAVGTGSSCSGSGSELAVCTLNGCRKFYAVPAESGTTGTSFSSSDNFNRLIIWCSVVAGCMLIATFVGLGLLCRQASTGSAF
uniref:Protein-tyrosine-phosphatase n=1 Tax=Macrostomum lignano TaxID=282301 RepID=A0A1I8FYL0_9PLAT